MDIILLVIAGILISIGIIRLRKYSGMNQWKSAKGVIISIFENHRDVAISEYAIVKYYYPEIAYTYMYDGKETESSNVCNNLENIWVPEVGDWGDPTPEDEKFWHKWEIGTEIEIFINPSNPEESVICRDLSRKYKSHNYALIVGGLLLAGAWTVTKLTT